MRVHGFVLGSLFISVLSFFYHLNFLFCLKHNHLIVLCYIAIQEVLLCKARVFCRVL